MLLVRRIRQKSAEACSLDRLSQLALMIGAGAGDTAGKDLRALGHALSELCGILIINRFCSVNAEHTDLFARPLSRSVIGSLHDNSPFKFLERYSVVAEDFLKVIKSAYGNRLVVRLAICGLLLTRGFISV